MSGPTIAMVLAAGHGVRMRPITETRPKPLIEVAGRTMLDRALDRLHAYGLRRAVVNHHHLGEMIEDHLAGREDFEIALSPEAELLETGGGVAKALPLLGELPFYVVNGDVIWLDGLTPAFKRLADAWNDGKMDALLLLHPVVAAHGYEGSGDYFASPIGQLRRRKEREVAPFIFAGLQILSPRLFAGAPDGAYSLNRLYDKAEEEGRLWGIRHDGEWYHVGTPESLAETEAVLSNLGPERSQK
ncbi:MAG: nucleotidyltransferase family protein [Pseudomonadota bacterium]